MEGTFPSDFVVEARAVPLPSTTSITILSSPTLLPGVSSASREAASLYGLLGLFVVITQTITQSSAVFSCYLDNTRIRIILEACAEARRLPQVQQVAGKRFLRRRWPFPFVEHVARLRGVRALASTQVQVGDVVQLHCTKLALGARGVCRHVSGLVVFTDALPGEELTARVNKVKKGYAEATKVATLQNPLNLADPPCPHFSVCGGCNYQNLQYHAQLLAKQQQVSETLQRIGGISNCDDMLLPIIPCQQQYHYRNNMQFTFSEAPFQHQERLESSSGSSTHTQSDPAKRVVIGLHKVNNPIELVPIEACSLQHDSANTLLQAVAEALAPSPTQPQQLSAFNPATQRGLLRQLILRRNSKNQYMVIFSTTSFQPALLEPLVTAVQSCNVEVLSIINTVSPLEGGVRPHRRKASKLKSLSSQRQQSHVLFGTSTITERLCELNFQISPESFFQVNSAQAEVLYDLVHKAAGLRPTDIVMDLFCGTGSIGLTLAKDCHHVYGFESTASSVADAKRNAEVNGISNATFVHGDLTKMAAMMGKQYPSPDVIVTDPARAGISLEVIKYMQQSGARTIVYVSCNPATQARDISQLCTGASAKYRLKHVQPCDMFPNSAHIECVAILECSGNTGAHAQTLAK